MDEQGSDSSGNSFQDEDSEKSSSQSDTESDSEYSAFFTDEAGSADSGLQSGILQEELGALYDQESLAGLGSFLRRILRNPLDRTGFSLLLASLRDCLLTHRWQEASQAIEIVCLYPTHHYEDHVWKCGMEILYNHPDSDLELIEKFARKMEGIYRHRKRKRLEKVFHLLSRGQFQDAEVQLQSAKITNQIRLKKSDVERQEYWMMMIKAYSGLLKYVNWYRNYLLPRQEAGTNQLRAEKPGFSDADGVNGSQFTVPVPDKPGVWDIFITKQAEILETNGKVDDARELLQKYITSGPDNPNAYKYLYRHLKRNNGDQQEVIGVLGEYVKRIPSDLLALDLVSLLQQGLKRQNPEYSNKIGWITNSLFEMLDYPCWYDRLAPWKALARHLTRILKKRDRVAMDAAVMCWSQRDWWLYHHFDPKVVKRLVKKSKEVALQKALVASAMQTAGKNLPFVKRVQNYFSRKDDRKSCEQLKKVQGLATRLVRHRPAL
ncbi:TATA box-binding protein-associated factor RNA polymerase I subunit A-like isoform X2 [Acanthaster planci]|uniref:TATA box-binding protein-associated factor RNA polymerase I subunit A-like isoform X2 n=1 Tax=Acanthaster planci TaxID=133434 RepID=A0A8B7YQY8_ACAPL|nr:TATA box-binding protein-associated factor RNA polymerase I subunit A-like isoform X2 [Acanthaster planci]